MRGVSISAPLDAGSGEAPTAADGPSAVTLRRHDYRQIATNASP